MSKPLVQRKPYIYRGEDHDAISLAVDGEGPNGGWVGVSIAKFGLPNAHKTRDDINAYARLIESAVTAVQALANHLSRDPVELAESLDLVEWLLVTDGLLGGYRHALQKDGGFVVVNRNIAADADAILRKLRGDK